jgi:hypothetical protein
VELGELTRQHDRDPRGTAVASLKVVGKEDLLEAPLSAQNEKGHRGVLLENLT